MASLLAADVHPAKIGDRMGHADPTMAIKRYSHVSPAMQRDAADSLAEVLAATTGQSVTYA